MSPVPDVETASRALERTNGTQFEGRTLTVEYVQNEDPNIRVPDFGGRGGRGRQVHCGLADPGASVTLVSLAMPCKNLLWDTTSFVT